MLKLTVFCVYSSSAFFSLPNRALAGATLVNAATAASATREASLLETANAGCCWDCSDLTAAQALRPDLLTVCLVRLRKAIRTSRKRCAAQN